jgi:hypothetical protein
MGLWNNQVARRYAGQPGVTDAQVIDFCRRETAGAHQHSDAEMAKLPVSRDDSTRASGYLVYAKPQGEAEMDTDYITDMDLPVNIGEPR